MFIRDTAYKTLRGVEAEIDALAARSGAEIALLGESTEGRPIRALCFGGGDYRKPELLYYALEHSMEYIGAEAALDAARRLADSECSEYLDKANVWVLPVLNPDGYARVEKQLSSGLGLAFARKNASGVDLNRNFPVAFYHFPGSVFAGSPLKFSPHYRGAEPCSEQETRVFRDFILGRNFKISLAFHCFGASILYPYFYKKSKCGAHDTLAALAGKISFAQRSPYSVKPGHKLYLTNGSSADWLYDEQGILALVMEIGKLGVKADRPESWINPFFWFNPVDPKEELDNIVPASLKLVEETASRFSGD